MTRQLALKELRETFWIGLIAMVFLLYFVGLAVNERVRAATGEIPLLSSVSRTWFVTGGGKEVPFVDSGFSATFTMISVCLVIALGLRQSLGDAVGDTYTFLLHRPVGRRRIFAAKLMVGLGVYWTVAAVPVLLYACWAATPGTHASPFYWSMTLPIWKVWLSMPVLYLGAFLSGIRPGRWKGSRLLPLAAAGLITMVAIMPPWWLMTGAVVLADAVLVYIIFFVAGERDYSS